MASEHETDFSVGEHSYSPGVNQLLAQLALNPTIDLRCAHGDGEPAVAIYEVPRGCVALPGVEVQPLCPYHRRSNGSFDGMIPIVDLSLGTKWSELIDETPDYVIREDPSSGELVLTQTTA